jgi:hypothetical protein
MRVIAITWEADVNRRPSVDDRNTSFHNSKEPISSPQRTTSVNEHTFAHSGTIVDDKGGDIFFVRHGESCFVVVVVER